MLGLSARLGLGVNRGTSVAALGGSGLSAYAVNDNEPATVADFAGVLNSGTEYYRVGGTATTFASMFTFARASNATMVDSDGNLKWVPHNLLLQSEDFTNASWIGVDITKTANQATDPDGGSGMDLITATASNGKAQQNITVPAGSKVAFWARPGTSTSLNVDNGTAGYGDLTLFTLSGAGSVTVRANNTAATINNVSGDLYFCTITRGATAGNRVSFSIPTSGETVYLWGAHLYRSDLGGMVNNPDRGDSYVPTTTAARYLPRRNHYRASTLNGIRNETASATNLLHTTGTLVTQSVTVSAVAHTLHFTGTGTVTLSGASTAGPLVGTGTGEDNRVSLTFTPSAGSLTLTVSGTVSNAQLEVGSVRSSYIPNLAGSGTVTRAAETFTAAGSNLDASTTAMSFHLAGEENYADLATAGQVELFDWRVDANNRITVTIDTDGAKTGTITLTMVNGGSSASVAATTQLTPGVNKAFNVAWRVTGSEINIALNGTAATATATAIGVPDLSSAAAAFEGRGTRSIFRQAAADWTDSGIESAST